MREQKLKRDELDSLMSIVTARKIELTEKQKFWNQGENSLIDKLVKRQLDECTLLINKLNTMEVI